MRMHVRTRLLVLTLSAFAAVGCAPRARLTNLYDTQRDIDAYVSSGRYAADFADVVARAQVYMERRATAVQKPAIVLDIDETSLSNWPAYRMNGWARITRGPCDLDKGPCGLRAWQEMGQSRALPPTVALVARAQQLGVAVFFISGRPPELQEATERNLREQGYTFEEVIVQQPGVEFRSAVDFKMPERRKIAERGYTILLSMGDQESDLLGGYAEQTFKLPNPVYYLP
jgi:acid phosphatase